MWKLLLIKERGQKGSQEKLNWHHEMVSAEFFAKPGSFVEHEESDAECRTHGGFMDDKLLG